MAFNPEEDDPFGAATQYFNVTPAFADPWQSLYPTSQPLPQGSYDINDLLSGYLSDPSIAYASSSRGQDTLPAMGVADDTNPVPPKSFWDTLKGIGTSALNAAATPKGLAALVPAILAMLDRQGAVGGGAGQGYQGPKQYARNVTQGKYGPIVKTYAAEGGLMQAYANGGEAQAYVGGKPLVMEDGGFVFTEEAANKLGKTGIAALGGERISAPGNGTNDKGITGIIGKNGVTPARVSKDEAYFSKEAVAANGGPKRMYALMNELQRKA